MKSRIGIRLCIGLTLAVVGGVFCGCVSMGVSLASSTVPVEPGEYTVIGGTEGRAWGVNLLGFPLNEPVQAKTARDRAIEAVGGDALINVSVSQKMYILLLVVLTETLVRGDAITINPDAVVPR